MEYQQIKYEVEDRILTITFNRPEQMNTYNFVLHNEIVDALDRADDDDNIRAIIITGAGKAFCAGMDLSEKGSSFDASVVPIEDYRDGGGMLALRMYKCKKPIIAAINGAAVGVGCTMTLPADVRIASTKAKMGIVFVRRGVLIDACSSWFLSKVLGIGRALEWALTGRVFTAQEAYEGGLLNYVVEPEELLPKAREIAREIAENTAPVSVAITRQLIWTMAGTEHPMQSHRIESKGFHWAGQQPDVVEGIMAFLEKRKPNYSMSVKDGMPPFYPWMEEPPFKE
ncbi:MAG: crotonase/enoyl-CoA hydratase family protein [Syntrophomonadaceae bacterium]|nr:crotonase/enoyl-CoA hydratase family protein [Syntrophomonadaceae bacterium]